MLKKVFVKRQKKIIFQDDDDEEKKNRRAEKNIDRSSEVDLLFVSSKWIGLKWKLVTTSDQQVDAKNFGAQALQAQAQRPRALQVEPGFTIWLSFYSKLFQKDIFCL